MQQLLELAARVADLERQILNVMRIGTIESIDYTAALATVRLEPDLIVTDITWTTRRAHGDVEWWAPEVGEQVVVSSPGGELSQAVIDRCLYQNSYPAPESLETVHSVTYADGAIISYDRENSVLSAILPAGATVELTADGGINIAGDVSVTGSISATEDITAAGEISDTDGELSRLRTNYNSHKHVGNLGNPTSPSDSLDQ